MHAYMIIAHNQFELLEKLIKALDDERNDIFVHIDAKVKNFDFEHFKTVCRKSRLLFTDNRENIKWGSFDMVKAEYDLLEKAFKTGVEYSYFHLISGVDLPLKSQNEIHEFFEKNNGKEFIHFTSENLNATELDRVRAYHFAMGRRNYINRAITKAESKLARALRINRINGLDVQKGGQWFSITYDFAKFILKNKDFVYKQFNHTFIPDEFFVQTLLINSPFKKNLFIKEIDNSAYMNMRYCDWKRGSPYTFRTEDYDELKNCSCLFARKFDLTTDSEIVEKILATLV